MATSLAEVDHHRAPNPRLRPPLPPGADGRNQRSRSSGRKRLAHLNQSLRASYIHMDNSAQKSYERPSPNEVKINDAPSQHILSGLPRWPRSTITVRQIRVYGPRCLRGRMDAINAAEVLVANG